MKKFYPFILTMIFLGAGVWAQAQMVYNSITSNPSGFTLDDANFWVGPQPANNCDNCIINIYSDVTMVPNTATCATDGTGCSTAFAPGTVPELANIAISNSTVHIYGATTLTINTHVEFTNTQVVIGNDPTTTAAIIINNQIGVDAASSIRLANINTSMNAANLAGVDPTGPYDDYGHTSKTAGIFTNLSSAIGGYSYAYTLVSGYIGNASTQYINAESDGTQYIFNCDGATPNSCIPGVIYGPAQTTSDPTFGLVFGSATTLPVSLVQFLGSKNADGSVKLSWSTAQEVNAGSFEVERSADQGSWDAIGTVKAKGNSSITTNYTYIDQFPLAGNNYYRLKMVDLDGRFKYSNTVLVSSAKDTRPLVVYQNPWVDQIRVKVNVNKAQTLTLTVSDMIGKTYLKQSYNAQAGDNYINLAPAGAVSGMYILHIQGTTYEQTVKLAKN
ncbi:MAG TPA: T9SS type A sorting domain-containing protein [Puia sp.]|nr:T9SS type A sorting domain-containing protein [Puia sp.]